LCWWADDDDDVCVGVQNSIRHNLSLHSRFMRVQNEGAGKSSWWMVNPDAVARAAKTPRRPRAFTMDTRSYERQRRGGGRTQRQSRDLLARAPAPTQRSPASAVSMVGDSPPAAAAAEEPKDPFGLEYRTRASSFGGRLSPIDARPEPPDSADYLAAGARSHYEVRPPGDRFPYGGADGQETLSETLADILAGDLNMSDVAVGSPAANPLAHPGYDPTAAPYCQPVSFYCEPSGADVRGRYEPGNAASHGSSSDVSCSAAYGCYGPAGGGLGVGSASPKGTGVGRTRVLSGVDHGGGGGVTGSMPNLSQLLTAPPPPQYRGPCVSSSPMNDDARPKSCMFESFQPPAAAAATMTKSRSGGHGEVACYGGGLVGRPGGEDGAAGRRLDQTAVARILAERPHLLGKMQKLVQLRRQQLAAELNQHQYHHQQHELAANQPASVDSCGMDFHPHTSTIPQSTTTPSDPPAVSEAAFVDPSANSFFPSDLDLSSVDFGGAAMDCDIDQVIRHELALDGKLDFMFDSLPTPTK